MARDRQERQEIQRKLLLALQTDCNRPNKEYAHELKLDASALSRLREKLEKDDLIKGYKAVLDPEKFGLSTVAFIQVALINTDIAHMETTAQFLSEQPEVQEIHSIQGDFDIFLKVRAKTNKDIWDFTNRLTESDNIKDTKSMTVMATIKETSDIAI